MVYYHLFLIDFWSTKIIIGKTRFVVIQKDFDIV